MGIQVPNVKRRLIRITRYFFKANLEIKTVEIHLGGLQLRLNRKLRCPFFKSWLKRKKVYDWPAGIIGLIKRHLRLKQLTFWSIAFLRSVKTFWWRTNAWRKFIIFNSNGTLLIYSMISCFHSMCFTCPPVQ